MKYLFVFSFLFLFACSSTQDVVEPETEQFVEDCDIDFNAYCHYAREELVRPYGSAECWEGFYSVDKVAEVTMYFSEPVVVVAINECGGEMYINCLAAGWSTFCVPRQEFVAFRSFCGFMTIDEYQCFQLLYSQTGNDICTQSNTQYIGYIQTACLSNCDYRL